MFRIIIISLKKKLYKTRNLVISDYPKNDCADNYFYGLCFIFLITINFLTPRKVTIPKY